MEFQDKTIECKDCHAGVTLTAGEQDFFTQKGLNMPGRCKPCRAQRKAERDGQQPADQAQNTRPQVVEPPPPGPGRRHGGGPRADSRGRGGRRDHDDY